MMTKVHAILIDENILKFESVIYAVLETCYFYGLYRRDNEHTKGPPD